MITGRYGNQQTERRKLNSMRLPGLACVGGDPDFVVTGGQTAVACITEFESNDVGRQGLAVRGGFDLRPVSAAIGRMV